VNESAFFTSASFGNRLALREAICPGEWIDNGTTFMLEQIGNKYQSEVPSMVSPRKLAANRANAKKSTGPRTAAGKARAAQNARRHGLRAAVLADGGFTEEVKELARLFAGKGANAEIFEAACRLAEAQLDHAHARRAKRHVWRQDPDFTKTTQLTLRRLLAIDRHEHRALSRRKFALRDFDAACLAALWFPPLHELPPTVAPAGNSARTNPPSPAGQDSARTNPPTGSARDDLARTNPTAR
jgi:hypothetical protein